MVGAWIWAAALLAGPDEKGLYFGAPGGTVTVPELAVGDGPFSVEFRFKTLEKLKGSFRIVSRAGAFFVDLGPSGKIGFSLTGDQGVSKTIQARAAWTDGKWIHVAAVWDGTEAAIHVDGKKAAGEKIDGFGKQARATQPLVIGHVADPRFKSKDFFEGFVSDVAVWNDAVSAPARLTGKEPKLAGYWPLRGKADGLSPGLARAGWCRTSWWYDEKPDRPTLHLFQVDAGLAGAARAILVDFEAKGEVGVLWQDKAGEVRITWVDAGLGEPRTAVLKSLPAALLAAGAADARGNLYYLMVESKPGDRVKAAMFLAGPDGRAVKEVPVDTSPGGWNIYEYGGRWTGSMAMSKDGGFLILPRTMHLGGDGLRHQGGIGVGFPADLSRFQVLGQTSGHSFGNLLQATPRGEFLGLELGDNYPRGLQLHRFTNGARASRVIFTYKTAHGTTPRGGTPPYPEISGPGKTFYKWSNDNGTYTELGGVVEGRICYSVFFATDRSPEGKVLDCSRIGVANEPRNLAMLRVAKNFEKGPGGSEVSDAILVPAPGSKPETGGFYDFGGRWQPQRVAGLLWLTDYAAGEAAHAPQVFGRKDGTITVLWEKTGGKDGAALCALTLDELGRKPGDIIRLAPLTLARETVPVRVGDRFFTLVREGPETRLAFLND